MECRTCGEKISKSAKVCPHCGEDGITKKTLWQKIKRATFWSIFILFILGYGVNKLGTALNEATMSLKQSKMTVDKKSILQEQAIKKQLIEKEKLKKSLQPKKDKLISLVKKEKKVFGPTWESENFLTFGMLNDGTQRDGFAQYICILKNDAGLKGHRIFIKIYDAASMMNGGKAIVIGESVCK